MGKRFSVTVGAVVLVAVAGCSSQAGSSEAVQDDVVASAASVVAAPQESAMATLEPMPSPSSLVGAYNMDFVTPSNNEVCDTGLAYACGDTGASGVGIVFYASAAPFACGPNLASSCNFLEVAPNLWDPNSQNTCPKKSCGGSTQQTSDMSFSGKGITGCTGKGSKGNYMGPQATAVGAGYANTTAMLGVCNSYDAPGAARAYTGGGMTDWSLPSLNELIALYYYPNRNAIGGFVGNAYWSSTGSNFRTQSNDTMNFGGITGGNGEMGQYGPVVLRGPLAVRPVRAF